MECTYKNNPCKAVECPKFGCGLQGFLKDLIEKEGKDHPKEKERIENLEDKYVKAWNKYPKSRGKGPATGNAFAEWVIEEIGLKEIGLNYECQKKVNFGKFKFKVDCAIPSAQNPK